MRVLLIPSLPTLLPRSSILLAESDVGCYWSFSEPDHIHSDTVGYMPESDYDQDQLSDPTVDWLHPVEVGAASYNILSKCTVHRRYRIHLKLFSIYRTIAILCHSQYYTLKKKGFFPNSQKRFCRCQKASKWVKMSKETIKKFDET